VKRAQAKHEEASIYLKASSLRASISFPRDLYHELELIAKQKKVSLAWVIRDAAERYVISLQGEAAAVQEDPI